MPQGVAKKRPTTSTQRRAGTAKSIEILGVKLLGMGRCTRCQEKDLTCFMVKGYARCNSCTEKNVKYCDGVFSDAEFGSVERAKADLKIQQEAQRAEVGRLAAAAASAFAALSAAQEKEIQLGQRLDKLTAKQSDMLLKELAALDALDAMEDSGREVAFSVDDQWEGGPSPWTGNWSELLGPGGSSQVAG